MARNDRIARLFKLLELIVRSRNGIVVATVVEKQGWKLRNVYRDLEALEKAGFPLVREGTKHRLMEGYLPAAQVGVDEEELLALHLARQQASGWQENNWPGADTRFWTATGATAAAARSI